MISNITNFKNLNDWFYLIPAVILVDFITLCLEKSPYLNSKTLDDWYNKFGLLAVSSDVLSILLVIMFTRYIYTSLNLNNPIYFIIILVAFQLIHDIFFYLAVIKPIPEGHNQMIDVFKAYSNENGANILLGDALLMLASVTVGSVLKSLPDHFTIATSFITLYSLCYILYTKKTEPN
jgi:hypothetical protein